MLGNVEHKLRISGIGTKKNIKNVACRLKPHPQSILVQFISFFSKRNTSTVYQQPMTKLELPNLPANESVNLWKARVPIQKCTSSGLINPSHSHAEF